MTEKLSLCLQLDTEKKMSRDDYLIADEEELSAAEEQQAQEEAHQHFVSVEFSDIILSQGPAVALGLLSNEARTEISQSIINNYHKRLVEANSGL